MLVSCVAGLAVLLAALPTIKEAFRNLLSGARLAGGANTISFDLSIIKQRRERFAGQKLTFLTTNDLHSAFEGFAGLDRTSRQYGHYARLGAMINHERRMRLAQSEIVITADSGDFMSGSIFDSLGPSEPGATGSNHSVPELEFFGHFGYDVVTLGNHDFDRGEVGLLHQLNKMASKLPRPPALLATNYVPPAAGAGDDLVRMAAIQLAKSVQRHVVLQFALAGNRSLRVGMIGLMSPDAALCSTFHRKFGRFTGFDDQTQRMAQEQLHALAAAEVQELRNELQCDIVVALYHGGAPDDEQLAAAVPSIDVILSGHSHEKYHRVSLTGTHYAQCGCEGRQLGILALRVAHDGSLELSAASESICRPVDAATAIDSGGGPLWDYQFADQMLPGWVRELQVHSEIGRAASSRGWSLQGPLYRGVSGELFSSRLSQHELTSVVAEGLLQQLNLHLAKLEPRGAPVQVYLNCPSCVRQESDQFGLDGTRIELSLSNVYSLLSISAAEPICVFYMRKQELANLIDFARLLEWYWSVNFAISLSRPSVEFEENPLGIPFVNAIRNLRLNGVPFGDWPDLIRVAASNYIAPFLWKSEAYTFGLFTTTPKNADGVPYSSVDQIIDERIPPEYILFAEYLSARKKTMS